MFNLPTPMDGNYIIYYGPKNSTSNTVYMFTKPSACNFLYFYLIGAGGGGGGGRTSTTTSARSGGGGGSSGAVTSLFIPAHIIIDSAPILIYPGTGGIGGASNTAGTVGGNSVISLAISTGEDIIINATGGNPGSAGVTSSSASGGTAPLASTSDRFRSLGLYTAFAGLAGGGSASAAATGTSSPGSASWGGGVLLSGGGGGQGGASTGPGASISFTGFNSIFPQFFTIPGGATSSAGGDGFFMTKPLVATGGGGGGGAGSSTTAVGGRGGDGAFGCGGGGGGCGGSNGAGAGGNGGPGLVLIAWM